MIYTSQMRFRAERRMERHEALGEWTILFVSMLIFYLSALDAFGSLEQSRYNELFKISVLTSSGLLIAYSTRLTMSQFGLKARRYRECAREIKFLAEDLKAAIAKKEEEKAESLREKYRKYCRTYDNHHQIDFDMNIRDKPSWRTQFAYWLHFWHYFVVLAWSFILSISSTYAAFFHVR